MSLLDEYRSAVAVLEAIRDNETAKPNHREQARRLIETAYEPAIAAAEEALGEMAKRMRDAPKRPRRDTSISSAPLSDALEAGGEASIDIPEDATAKEMKRLNSRLHNAAKKRGLKVSVRKSADGRRWVATVNGGTQKGTGK